MSTWNDFSVIRSSSCSILINVNDKKEKCDYCSSCKRCLMTLALNSVKAKNRDFSKVNDSYLTKHQLIVKLKELEREKKLSTSRTARFECKVKEHLVKEGVAVDFETNRFLKEIINSQSNIPFKKDSPQYLLWEQQRILSSLKSGNCMVWHPLIIRWCLSIYLKSLGTYQHICNSPF